MVQAVDAGNLPSIQVHHRHMHEHRIGVHHIAQDLRLAAGIHGEKIARLMDDLEGIFLVFNVAFDVGGHLLSDAKLHADDLFLNIVVAHTDELVAGHQEGADG